MRRKIVHTKQLKGKQKQRKIEKALKVLKVFEYNVYLSLVLGFN